jgi:hypothetical protein
LALGFLLLLPLQEFATWRGLSQGLQQDSARRADAEWRSGAMLQAIQVATSVDDLQSRMQRLQGPTLTPADRALPLPQLLDQLSGPSPQQLWTLIPCCGARSSMAALWSCRSRPPMGWQWSSCHPPARRDPFDRLLLAQAEREGLLLITADTLLARYSGPVRQQGSF